MGPSLLLNFKDRSSIISLENANTLIGFTRGYMTVGILRVPEPRLP